MTTQQEQFSAPWDAIAVGYDQYVTGSHVGLGDEALRRADLQPGMRFLDVACGSGALTIPAARRGARVVAVDISAAMIDRLTARAHAEGIDGLDARVMDGHALDFGEATFDVCGSQFGVMLFPDLPRGLAEMARVTRPGGRVVVVAFGPPNTVEFFAFFLGAMQAAVPGFVGPPMHPPPLPFQLADPEVFRRALVAAGLTDVQVETITGDVEYYSGQHMWDWITNSNPIGAALVADLSAEQGVVVRDVLDGLLRDRRGDDGRSVLHHQIHIGIGTR